MFKPSKILKRYYDRYNKELFDGALPKDVEVGWDTELSPELYGLTLALEETECTKRLMFSIHIATDLKKYPGIAEMTLIHEMVHVKLYPHMKHGKKFQEEMLRVANRGAFFGLW